MKQGVIAFILGLCIGNKFIPIAMHIGYLMLLILSCIFFYILGANHG